MAVVIIATSLPTLAASTNGINKIITVEKNTVLKDAMAPELKIKLKDGLRANQVFYLNLLNAQWADQADEILNADPRYNESFIYRLSKSKTQLEVKAKEAGVRPSPIVHRIPMFVEVRGGEATVEIDPNHTGVAGGKYVFAVSTNN